MRKLFFRMAEALGLLKPATTPFSDPIPYEDIYNKPAADVRAFLVNTMEAHRVHFHRYRSFAPEALGFCELNAGCFGRVYISPCGRFVLKVSIHNDDDAYGTYVNLATKRDDNPFFPKVFCHLRSGNRNVVLTERLQPIAYDDMKAAAFVKDTRDRVVGKIPVMQKGRRRRHAKGYAELVEDLTVLVHLCGYRCDLARCNVMQRENEDGTVQYVVTDPVC